MVHRRIRTAGCSYFSYGRVVYQAPSYPFFGRWHLDSRNFFILKVRGIDLRRSDTPPLVAEAQQRMLEILAEADDLAGYAARIPRVLELLVEYAWRLAEGQV